MVHIGGVRQTAAIVAMEQDHLRAGDKSRIIMRFVKSPEFLRAGARLIFREGRTKAVGTITRTFETPQAVYTFPPVAPAAVSDPQPATASSSVSA